MIETIKHTVKIPADRHLHIQLPDSVAIDEEAEVIVTFKTSSSSHSAKLSAMREAATDPAFLSDLTESMEDFQYADSFEE